MNLISIMQIANAISKLATFVVISNKVRGRIRITQGQLTHYICMYFDRQKKLQLYVYHLGKC